MDSGGQSYIRSSAGESSEGSIKFESTTPGYI